MWPRSLHLPQCLDSGCVSSPLSGIMNDCSHQRNLIYIGILLKSYFIIGFSGFILLSIFPGLFCHPFSYRITLGENTITIKENSCCCANNITYSPGEILNFYVQDDDIKYLDNKGKTRSFGPQDYFKAELEYTVYKLNKFIETKMKLS